MLCTAIATSVMTHSRVIRYSWLVFSTTKRQCCNVSSPELLPNNVCMEHYMLHVSYSSSPFSTFTVEVGPIPYAGLACSWSRNFGSSYRASFALQKMLHTIFIIHIQA